MVYTALLRWLVSGALIFSATVAYSVTNADVNQQAFSPVPLLPRVTVWGMGGSHPVAQGEAMIPFYGNTNAIIYADLQSKTAFDTSWLGSGGIGYRQVYKDEQILGAYAF